MPSIFSPEQRADYERDGFVMVRKLFAADEIDLMRTTIEQDPQLRASLYDRKDANGKPTRMATWNHPGDSAYGLAARSHRVGCVDHGVLPGEQVGADPRRVEPMLKSMELVHAEMDPGDALFFHSNVMHRSDANRSPRRRWTVLFCYNAASNDPYLEHHHPRYTPLLKVSDEAMREAGLRFSAQGEDVFRKAFANPPELKRRIETTTEGPL